MKMKKIFIGLFLFFVSVFFITKIFAQEDLNTQVKSELIEFNYDAIYIPCEDPGVPLCVPYPTNVSVHPDPLHVDHEFGISTSGLPANTDVYIVGCIDTANGIHCTTGDTALDDFLNNIPGGDQMSPDSSHQFKALQNPIKTDANGDLTNVIVRSYTPLATNHYFNGYYISDVEITPTPIVSPTIVGSDLTIKQSTIDFEKLSPTPRPRAVRVPMRNDPKGRFFDSKSLEPIPEGELSLLSSLKKIFIYPKLENPQKVKINGEFNFWVPNGIYYLDIIKKPANHSWPMKLDDVHLNYSKAYYCDTDVKDEKNLPVPLYLQQYSIIEFNKLVHCDVPFDPGTSIPYRSDVKTVTFGISRTNNNTATSYTGQATHPLTGIDLKGEVTGKIAASTTADKLGFWQLIINNNVYPLKTDGAPDRLIAVYTKVDLTNSNQVNKPVNGTIYEPLLTYIEGYAYDKSGNVLSLARVGYRQQGTEKIVYVTTTDTNGFFKIPTRYLPSFGYALVFTPSGSTTPIIYSTSEFSSKNADYLKKNNINLSTKTSGEFINTKTVSQETNNISQSNNNTNQNKPLTEKGKNKSNSSSILITILVLIVFAIVAVVITIVMIKKNQTQSPSL